MPNYDDFDLDIQRVNNSDNSNGEMRGTTTTTGVITSMLDSCSAVTGTAATGCQETATNTCTNTCSQCHSYCGGTCRR